MMGVNKVKSIVLVFSLVISSLQMTNAQNFSDTVSKIKYRIGMGASCVQLQASQLEFANHSVLIGSNGGYINGGVASGEVIYDIKHSPISLVGDFSFVRFNLSMQQYDSTRNLVNESWIKNVNLASMGTGILIEGNHVFAGAKYRFGFIGGGYNSNPLTYNSEIVKNNRLNLMANTYSNLELSFGAKYKKWSLATIWGLPISKQVNVGNGWSSGFFSGSLVLGFTLDGKIFRTKSI